VHIRRGDYLNKIHKHPTQPKEYYYSAFSQFNEDIHFLIFSDDIEWCKNNLKYKYLYFIEEELDYISLYLMSLCNHNIIANSSFSWWGAWLNQETNKKVIAPSNWFGKNKKLNTKDLIPSKWIKL